MQLLPGRYDSGDEDITMATHGTIAAFSSSQETWTVYVERLEQYFAANKIEDADQQRAILLSVCGPATYRLICNLVSPKKPMELKIEDLITIVQKHHDPKPSMIVQKFRFNGRNRRTGESVAAYVAELRQLAEHCQYATTLNDMLRDRLVCGVEDSRIQHRLLAELELTFEKAFEIAMASESAEKNVKDLQSPVPVNKLKTHGTQNPCYRCGEKHKAADCRFKTAECRKCGKKGHIARVCKSKPLPKGQPLLVSVSIDNASLEMEVDTGASVSIISEETYNRLWSPEDAPPLQKSSVKLRTYSGEQIGVKGSTIVTVKYKDQTEQLPLVVANGSGPSLLGRDWLMKICLDWTNLFCVNHACYSLSLQGILDTYTTIFSSELGGLKGTNATIRVDPTAQPRFHKPRAVPYALKAKIEKELDRLIQQGVIEPIEFSEWAAPIVPVLKKDGSIRICGDYKVTINQASQVDSYPLSRIDDLFASLAGGKRFSKLDLAHAYQQIPLDDASKKLVAINTHKGLFQYNRLPFGVSAAPSIFQRTVETLLQSLPGVCLFLDDILVSGQNDQEHLTNLSAVLQKLTSAGMKLKPDKCFFMLQEVEYLGHKISAKGLEPIPEKVRAIVNLL